MRFTFKSLLSLSNQKGFSLTEVMVGGGILAGVALAGAQMFKDQKKAQKKIEHEQNLAIYHNNLAKKLGMAANCNATLKAAGLYGASSIPTGTTLSSLQTCVTGCTDTNVGGTNQYAYDANSIGTTSADLTPNAASGWIDGTQVWKADSATIIQGRNTTGKITVRLQYSLNPNKFANARTVSKDLFMNVRFGAGQFKECLDAQESNVNNLQKDLCKSLNYNDAGTIDSSGKMARWDDATQTCKVDGAKDCAAMGMMIQGIRSDGTVHCKPISDTAQGVNLNGATTQNCSGGKKPHVQYNSTTKKVEIICQ